MVGKVARRIVESLRCQARCVPKKQRTKVLENMGLSLCLEQFGMLDVEDLRLCL